jgi:hypothetical protein
MYLVNFLFFSTMANNGKSSDTDDTSDCTENLYVAHGPDLIFSDGIHL